ncbi:hypothetical protein [Paracholeplasma manati]|uniref:hypothetical protein n=1 Tax=Paracholeplasma manati TaxID=591373 RepID=UPI002408105E|nr:hypothetical protein [Paracholeplasma manati]MDG0887852.1 hypothetical protein [Paracholeplasma manati]
MRFIKLVKEFAYFISGFALQGVATLLGQLNDSWINVKTLLFVQIMFYGLSSLLVLIGIIQVILRKRNKHKKKDNLINKAVDAQKAKSTITLVQNPSKKGELFVLAYHLFLEGGRQMKAKFASLGIVQIISLISTLVLLALAFASAFYPELSVVADNMFLILTLVGITSTPGILAHGKDLGEQFRNSIERMNSIKKLNALIKVTKKELDKLDSEYAFLKPALERLNKFKVPMTPDVQIKYDTYQAQRQIFTDLIKSYEDEIVKLQEVPK